MKALWSAVLLSILPVARAAEVRNAVLLLPDMPQLAAVHENWPQMFIKEGTIDPNHPMVGSFQFAAAELLTRHPGGVMAIGGEGGIALVPAPRPGVTIGWVPADGAEPLFMPINDGKVALLFKHFAQAHGQDGIRLDEVQSLVRKFFDGSGETAAMPQAEPPASAKNASPVRWDFLDDLGFLKEETRRELRALGDGTPAGLYSRLLADPDYFSKRWGTGVLALLKEDLRDMISETVHRPAKIHPLLKEQIQKKARRIEAVVAVWGEKETDDNLILDEPKRFEERANELIDRVAKLIGIQPQVRNVFRNMQSFIVVADWRYVRTLLEQPEVKGALPNRIPKEKK